MLRTAYLRLTASNYAVICHGNSLTAGAMASGPSKYWPAVMSAQGVMAQTGVSAINAGVSGQTIASVGGNGNMTATGPAAVDAALQAGKTNIIFAWEFVNELGVTALDVAGAKTRWMAYCADRKAAALAAGKTLRLMSCTVPPGKISAGYAVSDAAYCVALKHINNWMRSTWRDYADGICDFAAAPEFAAIWSAGTFTADEFDATGLYSTDRFHFGDPGYALIGRIGASTMLRIPA